VRRSDRDGPRCGRHGSMCFFSHGLPPFRATHAADYGIRGERYAVQVSGCALPSTHRRTISNSIRKILNLAVFISVVRSLHVVNPHIS